MNVPTAAPDERVFGARVPQYIDRDEQVTSSDGDVSEDFEEGEDWYNASDAVGTVGPDEEGSDSGPDEGEDADIESCDEDNDVGTGAQEHHELRVKEAEEYEVIAMPAPGAGASELRRTDDGAQFVTEPITKKR